MIKANNTSDNLFRWLVLLGELVILNASLVTLFYFYKGEAFMSTPNCKRLMLLMSMVYVFCDIQGRSKIHLRFVRGDQILRNMGHSLILFTTISLLTMWVFRWPLLTWGFMVPFYGFILSMIVAFRWTARQFIKWYRKIGRNSMSVVFVGNIDIVSEMYKNMEKDPTCGYRVIGYFNDEEKPDVTPKGHLGRTEDVLTYLEDESRKIHRLYCMLPSSENQMIKKIIRACDRRMIRYNHIPDSFNYKNHNMALDIVVGTPVMSMHNEPLTNAANRMAKRLFDIVFSLTFLLTLFPIICAVFGILIKRSSPGPILFRQKRSGLGGKEFWCYKFRSMRMNDDSDILQATKDDPRKTRIGEIMRKTSIDELPQFINVLKGDMSVVGPRPHMVKHTQEYSSIINEYMVRHLAKPGITGWAQVTGFRGETKELWQMKGRVERDIWYIENWSFALDLMIIFKTITNAIRGEKEAY